MEEKLLTRRTTFGLLKSFFFEWFNVHNTRLS